MRVVVTGGAGFIGHHLVGRLVADGHDVVVVDDLSTGDPSRLPSSVELCRADVSDTAVARVVARARPDAVIHAAAQISVPRSLEDPARDRAVNVEGTRNVVRGAIEGEARRFVFISSGGAVYGEADGATEETQPAPISPYGRSKLAAEEVVRGAGLSCAIARPANVYGPGQRSDLEGGVVAIFAERLKAGSPIELHGTGAQRRDFVHVADVVDALVAMLHTDLAGVWNVATGFGVSILELLVAIERQLGRTAEVVHRPPRPGDVVVSRLSADRAARDLGWTPKLDLASGLATLL